MGSRPDEGNEVKGKDGVAEVAAETKPSIPLAPISSVGKPWAEEIELDWKVDVTRFDLTALRDFFKQGMDFSVIEEMVSPVTPIAWDLKLQKKNGQSYGGLKFSGLTNL